MILFTLIYSFFLFFKVDREIELHIFNIFEGMAQSLSKNLIFISGTLAVPMIPSAARELGRREMNKNFWRPRRTDGRRATTKSDTIFKVWFPKLLLFFIKIHFWFIAFLFGKFQPNAWSAYECFALGALPWFKTTGPRAFGINVINFKEILSPSETKNQRFCHFWGPYGVYEDIISDLTYKNFLYSKTKRFLMISQIFSKII